MPSLHPTTFAFLAPSKSRKAAMDKLREAARVYAELVDETCPIGDNGDRDHALRLIREAQMWANISITRFADGTPREPTSQFPADPPEPTETALAADDVRARADENTLEMELAKVVEERDAARKQLATLSAWVATLDWSKSAP